MKISKWIWGLMLISIVGTLIVYPSLPETIPIHWNISGEVDNYGGKTSALFTAVLPILLAILLIYLPKIDPKKESYKKHKKAYEVVLGVLAIFFVFIHWLSLSVALGYSVSMNILVGISVGILFIVIGNYLPQIRHNYFFGIRTPWTLASEKVWDKTHRVGSWVFILIGLFFIANGFLKNQIIFKASFIFTIAAVIFLFGYSYFEFKKTED